MTSASDLVFVYGTLRRGGSNHFRMDGAVFLTTAKVRGRLYHIDWFPGLVLDATGDEITGEIYQVTRDMLDRLDAFEGGDYRRVLADATPCGDDPPPLSPWLWEWLGECDESQRIPHGDWLDVRG